MNLGDMAKSMGFEEDEFCEMLELFVEATIADLEKLKFAIDQSMPELVVEASHSIKGAAGSFGFDEISKAAGKIEMQARQKDLKGSAEIMDGVKAQLDGIISTLQDG